VPDLDLSASQSPLEGSYKHLGDLRRGSAAGIITLIDILFFWVLKWNLKTALKKPALQTPFLKSSYGCYALDFVDRVLRLEAAVHKQATDVFPEVNSDERLGLFDYKTEAALQAAAAAEANAGEDGLAPIEEGDEADGEEADTHDPADGVELDEDDAEDDYRNATTSAVKKVTAHGRDLISLQDDTSLRVVSYTLPPSALKDIDHVAYSNFEAVPQTELLIGRKRGVINKIPKPAPPNASNNYERLSATAQFAVEHLNMDPHSYNEELNSREWQALYRLAKSRGWSSFDRVDINYREREKRRDVFQQEQLMLDTPRIRLKTLAGFEASLRKMERSMCWKAARKLCACSDFESHLLMRGSDRSFHVKANILARARRIQQLPASDVCHHRPGRVQGSPAAAGSTDARCRSCLCAN
jgi:hypothetical protein